MGLKTIAIHLGMDIVDLGVGTGVLMGVGAGVATLGAIPVVAGVALGAACAVPAIIFANATSHLVDFVQHKLGSDNKLLARSIKVFGCAAGIAMGIGAAAGVACIPALGLTAATAATIIGAVAVAAAVAFVASCILKGIFHLIAKPKALGLGVEAANNNQGNIAEARNRLNYAYAQIDAMDLNQGDVFTDGRIEGLFPALDLEDIYIQTIANMFNQNQEDNEITDKKAAFKEVMEGCMQDMFNVEFEV